MKSITKKIHPYGASAVLLLLFSLPRPAAAQAGTFFATGAMSNARIVHTATLMANGKVLVAGGFNPGFNIAMASAEVYDPNTGLFSATGSLSTARRAHSAVLLTNGKVMVFGGRQPPTYFTSAELYDPSTGLFSFTGSMGTPRAFTTATLLANGKVLVAGGLNGSVYLASAEIYDPETGLFSPTGSMSTARNGPSATLLPDGRVLIAGGDAGAAIATAELYDPDTGRFTLTGSMSIARTDHTATLLPPSTLRPHGKVLIAGGIPTGGSAPSAFASAELYDPDTGLFTATGSMTVARDFHTAILLPAYELRPHGKVLIAGGDTGNFTTGLLASAELYDPDTGRFSATGSLITALESNTITLLADGRVLLTGGGTSKTTFASAELYALPPTYTLTDLGTLPDGTFSQAAIISNNGLIGGSASPADGTQHATLWYKGQLADIAAAGFGGPNSGVFGINETGQVTGTAETSTVDPNGEDFCSYGTNLKCLPFVSQNGLMISLPTLGGPSGQANQINNRGQVAGVAENSTKDKNCVSPQVLDYEAVIWGPNPGQIQQLNPLPGDTIGMALWINDNGQAVGASGSCANSLPPPLALGPHAVLWENDGSAHDLGNLGGTSNAALGVGNAALSINNKGQVVGGSDLPGDTVNHAFLWTKENGMQDLGTLPGDVNSAGLGINDRGEVVGVSYGADGPFTGDARAFVRQNGVMYDLNTLVPAGSPLSLMFAGVVNAGGQIIGFGMTKDGDVHGFLATPSSGADTSESLSSTEPGVSRPMALREDARKRLQRSMRFGGGTK